MQPDDDVAPPKSRRKKQLASYSEWGPGKRDEGDNCGTGVGMGQH